MKPRRILSLTRFSGETRVMENLLWQEEGDRLELYHFVSGKNRGRLNAEGKGDYRCSFLRSES